MVEEKLKRGIRAVEMALWAAGSLALGYCAFQWGWTEYAQWAANQMLEENPIPRSFSPVQRNPRISEGRLVGRLEIDRLKLSAIVFEGTSDATLARGIGHLRSSAEPGGTGNSVFAAHRDTFFRPLRNVRKGDVISVTTQTGSFKYVVESTKVVPPDAIEVLKPTDNATVTLITCYPFRYIGNAPERFVVRGRAVQL